MPAIAKTAAFSVSLRLAFFVLHSPSSCGTIALVCWGIRSCAFWESSRCALHPLHGGSHPVQAVSRRLHVPGCMSRRRRDRVAEKLSDRNRRSIRRSAWSGYACTRREPGAGFTCRDASPAAGEARLLSAGGPCLRELSLAFFGRSPVVEGYFFEGLSRFPEGAKRGLLQAEPLHLSILIKHGYKHRTLSSN